MAKGDCVRCTHCVVCKYRSSNEQLWIKEHCKLAARDERPHGMWIPCSERLPEKQGQYYVSGGDKVWICDFLIFSNLKGGWCNNVSNPVVEAWMELPKPYEKEGE